jgi:Dolichyl-phosphate-mannose-protein mannosyltransferase
LLALAALLLIWSFWVVGYGGLFIEWHGWRLSSREPVRPLLAATLVLIIAVWRHGVEGVRRELASLEIPLDRWAGPLVVILSVAVLLIGLIWGTAVAGGADSYGYVSQSRLWTQGNLIVDQPIAAKVPWPNADWTFAPLGYKPWSAGHAIVPTYAPGLPMLMALFSLVHSEAVYWVVPLAGAALVALSFSLSRSLAGPTAGLLAAVLMATSPAFLFQLVAPMSDVVIAAFWVAALVAAIPNRRERWLGSGLVSSFAILTRPNTAAIAAVFVLAALAARQDDVGGRSDYRTRILNALAYVTGTLPGVLSVAAIHTALYGSPFESGYGAARDLYALQNFPTNVVRYSTWLVASETPLVCLAAAAPILVWHSVSDRWLTGLTVCLAVSTWLCYVFYRPFQEWWYLRFLLTAFPCLLALTALTLTRLLTTVRPGWRMPLAVTVLAPVLMWRINYAADHGAFDSWRHERRYADSGRYVARRLPANAALYSMQESGSLRHYGGRLTIRWDALDPTWLDRSIDVLRDLGYEPYFVLEEPEEADFRGRFAAHGPLGRLNWPPLAELPTSPVVRIYDPGGAKR